MENVPVSRIYVWRLIVMPAGEEGEDDRDGKKTCETYMSEIWHAGHPFFHGFGEYT
ncbi:hypothetical protein EI94DRAFT_1726789 [Lactarius quietus]|nr:hypothetical protein EI94DRAFT_1726789 [Lactarius quietus]